MRKHRNTAFLFVLALAMWSFSCAPADKPASSPAEPYAAYQYGSKDSDRVIDFGTVPSSMQTSFVSETLLHDEVLARQLSASGWKLREHRYRNGAVMAPYQDGRLDLMVLGDSAAIAAAARADLGIYLTVSGGAISLVAKRHLLPAELKGLKIAYVPGTVTHFCTYRTLSLGGLTEADIVPLVVQADKAESALQDGTVDAAAVYEPFTSQILHDIKDSSAIARVDIYTFLVMDEGFATRNPEMANAVLAAVCRASRWAGISDGKLGTVMTWIRQAQVAYLGSTGIGNGEPWLSQLRKETIDKPSYPMLPPDFVSTGSLQHQQFTFLVKTGQIDASLPWQAMVPRVKLEALSRIIHDAARWELDRFEYATNKLWPPGEQRL